MSIEAEIKKWGNSFGIILPKSLIEEAGLKEKDKIVINVIKKADISKTFGTIKRKLSGKEFKEIVKKSWEK